MTSRPHIALTITGCKRPELFVQTVESLCERMNDIHLVDTVIHYDDSSSDEDRRLMNDLLMSKFPDKIVCSRYFSKESFRTEKRHMCVMNHWLEDLSRLCVDYVFHTEDDWIYNEDFSISEAILIMQRDESCGQVGFSQPLRRFPEGTEVEMCGDYWVWHYRPDLPILENLFVDEVMIANWNVPGLWLYYINWPHFSLRPGVFKVDSILSVGDFRSDDGESFEFNFAKRYVEKYRTILHRNAICWHTGQMNSSYELNKSDR